MKVRIGILIAIVALVAGALAAVAFWPVEVRQYRILAAGAVLEAASVLLLLWLIFAAPFRWRTRLAAAGAILATVALATATLRIGGVTGDLVPILEWRWTAAARQEATRLGAHRERSGDRGQDAATSSSAAVRPVSLEPIGPEDYPRFLGARCDGASSAEDPIAPWGDTPPQLVWRRPVGAAWSSFAVANGYAVTQEQRGEDECVVCYELDSGAERWAHSDSAHFQATIGGEGPRATPTVDGGRVYAVGATGILNCLEGSTGQRVWSHKFVEENGGSVREWGSSCSPLVHGGKVFVCAGGKNGASLVAYDARSGELVASGGSDSQGYASPFVTSLAGVDQIILFNKKSLAAHDPASGKLLWRYPWETSNPTVTQPVPVPPDRLLVTAGYGMGCELIELHSGDSGELGVRSIWKNTHLKSKFANVLVEGGVAYGLDDGILTAIQLSDGKRLWKEGRYGHGQLLRVRDQVLIQCESGEVVLAKLSTAGPEVLSRWPALDDKTWNHPVYRPPYLLVRNNHEAACYRLVSARR